MKRQLYLPLLLTLLASLVFGVLPIGSGVAYASPAAPVYRTFSENFGEGISILVDKPSGTVDGDLLVAGMTTDDGTTLTPPVGWTLINQGSSGAKVTSGSWWKVASSEPANYTFQVSVSQPIYIFILRIDGQHATTPIDVSVFGFDDSTTPTCPSVTANVDECLILRLFGADDNDITIDDGYPTAHTGITVNQSADGNGQCSGGAAYTTQALAGATGTASFTLTAAEEWYATTIAIKPPPPPDISNTPTSYGFGTVAESSTTPTGLTHFTVTNNSAYAVNITISGTDMTGGTTWTLSNDGSAGNMIYGLNAGLEGGSYNVIVNTAGGNTLVSGLAGGGGTQKWGLQLLAPTTMSDGASKSGTVTLTAAAA